jgi:SPP1 family phage portal protein
MLTKEQITNYLSKDKGSRKKQMARVGARYYEGAHDILGYRMFYYNADGELIEDKQRSNLKIPHPFFTELVDQEVQYILSGERIVYSDNPWLQAEMDNYFNYNETFGEELEECLTDCIVKGSSYMYAYKAEDDRTSFKTADMLGITEVRANETDRDTDYIIYRYIERMDDYTPINRVQVWDDNQAYFYVQEGEGQLEDDKSQPYNPRPHTLYQINGDKRVYFESYGTIPFFRLDNNSKQQSGIKPIKPLIDDYDLMASSLSNNLVDFDTPIHVVKGFEGDNLDELQQNIRTKKLIGVGEDGDLEIKTIEVPYQARLTKLELDEKNIYRFGMGLNMSGLKDTSATTNIAIKAAYSLLELKCFKLEIKIKSMLRKMVKLIINEINAREGTGYSDKDVYFKFTHEIMSNAQENAQIKLTEAQANQVAIATIQGLADVIDDDTIIQLICEQLDISYEDIMAKLPDNSDGLSDIYQAKTALNALETIKTDI